MDVVQFLIAVIAFCAGFFFGFITGVFYERVKRNGE